MILPRVKITELLLEVDEWTGFTRHFAHLKSGDLAKDKNLLLTTILADAISLGLTKMAESCPGTTYANWLGCKLACPRQKPTGRRWPAGQRAVPPSLRRALGRRHRVIVGRPELPHRQQGRAPATSIRKYGGSPGRTFYTHISDQYAPFPPRS